MNVNVCFYVLVWGIHILPPKTTGNALAHRCAADPRPWPLPHTDLELLLCEDKVEAQTHLWLILWFYQHNADPNKKLIWHSALEK